MPIPGPITVAEVLGGAYRLAELGKVPTPGVSSENEPCELRVREERPPRESWGAAALRQKKMVPRINTCPLQGFAPVV